ncbi:YtjB family periplasmic protein [Catenovulum sp. 2E275]|uniref:YtjB family periplasmic protein n=1 Tax=Catenovulum sp. 2E275 TaxID=2980497 RepID=UPI0021D3165A|nr:YtjB family periplasmic protein [Catenovulum sp. 2E275]MCU4676997.1 YtjB family periplasmic protein [Catenovulum sp. 2E275]
MNLINNIYKSDKRWIIRKIVQAGLASAIIFVILGLWLDQNRYFDVKFREYNYQTARELSDMLAQRFLYMKGFENAAETLDYIVISKRIIDASLYDEKGKIIARSTNSLSVADATGLNPYGSVSIIPTVTELYDDNHTLLGYLRVSYDKNRFNEPQQQMLEKQSSTGRLMLFLAGLAGLLFSRAFYRQVSNIIQSDPAD